jgi:hypothetical protein
LPAPGTSAYFEWRRAWRVAFSGTGTGTGTFTARPAIQGHALVLYRYEEFGTAVERVSVSGKIAGLLVWTQRSSLERRNAWGVRGGNK